MGETEKEPRREARLTALATSWGCSAGLLGFAVGALVVFMLFPFCPVSRENLWPMVCGGAVLGLTAFVKTRKWILRKYSRTEDE